MSEQEAVIIPSAVQRVDDATGSHIEPPLDENWSDLQKLQWHAAVTALDTGCEVTVKEVRRNLFSVSWRTATMSTSTSGSPFYVTWTYLSGMAAGATARVSEVAAVEARVRREAAAEALRAAADDLDICDCWNDKPPRSEHAPACAVTLLLRHADKVAAS